MAEIAHTIPAPEIHELSGSSPPGAGTLAQVQAQHEPQSRLHARRAAPADGALPPIDPHAMSWLDEMEWSDYDWTTHPERDLIGACGDAADLVEKDQEAWGRVADLDAEDDHPLVAAARQTSAAVRAASLDLSTRRARTPEGLGAKASFLEDVIFPSGKNDCDIYGHEDCLKSLFVDARALGLSSRFTIARLAGLEIDPPVRAPEEGWNFQHLIHDWAQNEINSRTYKDIIGRLEDLHPHPDPAETMLVRESDSALFKIDTSHAPRTINGDRFYDGSSVVDALRTIMANDSPNLTLKLNLARQARAREILDARLQWETTIRNTHDKIGLVAERRAEGWSIRKGGALRSQIAGTQVNTLEGLLMKALVYADCLHADPRKALDETGAELLEISKDGCSNEVMLLSIAFDLLHLVVARGISVFTAAGQFTPEHRGDRSATATEAA